MVGGVAVIVVLSVATLAVVAHDALGGAVALACLVVTQRAVVVALTSCTTIHLYNILAAAHVNMLIFGFTVYK